MVVDVKLCREPGQPFGFRLIGGRDFEIPLTVSRVSSTHFFNMSSRLSVCDTFLIPYFNNNCVKVIIKLACVQLTAWKWTTTENKSMEKVNVSEWNYFKISARLHNGSRKKYLSDLIENLFSLSLLFLKWNSHNHMSRKQNEKKIDNQL
jgi:hypothetical protein